MNDAFVCIKVDREERPDVDSLYMSIAMRDFPLLITEENRQPELHRN